MDFKAILGVVVVLVVLPLLTVWLFDRIFRRKSSKNERDVSCDELRTCFVVSPVANSICNRNVRHD